MLLLLCCCYFLCFSFFSSCRLVCVSFVPGGLRPERRVPSDVHEQQLKHAATRDSFCMSLLRSSIFEPRLTTTGRYYAKYTSRLQTRPRIITGVQRSWNRKKQSMPPDPTHPNAAGRGYEDEKRLLSLLLLCTFFHGSLSCLLCPWGSLMFRATTLSGGIKPMDGVTIEVTELCGRRDDWFPWSTRLRFWGSLCSRFGTRKKQHACLRTYLRCYDFTTADNYVRRINQTNPLPALQLRESGRLRRSAGA